MAVSEKPVCQNMVARGHQGKQLVTGTGRQAQPKGSADEKGGGSRCRAGI